MIIKIAAMLALLIIFTNPTNENLYWLAAIVLMVGNIIEFYFEWENSHEQ